MIANSPEAEPAVADSAHKPDIDKKPTIRYDSGWLMSIQRPALIAVMVACINFVLLAFLRRFMPETASGFALFVAIMGVAAALIGCTTTAWLAQPNQRIRRTTGYRVAEIALILVVTRLAVWGIVGQLPTLRAFMTRPLESFFDGFYLVAMMMVALSWIIATEMSRDLLDMALQPDELRLLEEGSASGGQPVGSDRRLLQTSFVTRWVIGGVIIVILAAGARVNLAGNGFFALTRQNVPASVVVSIVFYFLAGLVLISQAQLAVLRARWTLEQTPELSTVSRNWPFYVFVVVTGVGLLAAFMPFGGTYYLALLVSAIVGVLYTIFFFIFQAISAIFVLLLSLLPMGQQEEAPPPPPVQPMLPQEPPPPPSEFLEWVSGAMFWLIAAAIVGYLAVIYFSDKGNGFAWFRLFWELLRQRLRSLHGAYQEWHDSRETARSETSEDGARTSLWRRLWPQRRQLSPDEQVKQLYLTALKNAEDAGIGRRQAETPISFAPRLEQELTDSADAEVAQLTAAFVGVRYAREHYTAESVAQLDILWQRLRAQLHRRGREKRNPSPAIDSDD